MPYAILLNELKPLDLQKTAAILAKAEDIIYADATRSVRNCCGVLAMGLPFDEAKSISDELNREGIGVFYMDQSQMYYPEPTVHVNNADCLEQCFDVQDMYGRSHPLLWANTILISLGRVVERKERGGSGGLTAGPSLGTVITHSLMGIPGRGMVPRPSMPPTPRKITEEEHLILDIFSEVPQKKHYRIQQKAFNYDYLGHRLKSSSAENIRLLVEDLVGYAKQAYGNRGINAFLSGKEPEKMHYNDLDHFDKENLWLLQLIHLGPSASEEGKSEE